MDMDTFGTKKKTTNISIKHPLICLQLYSSSQWMECDFETVRPSKYWHCCFEETCSNMFRLLSDFPQKENICFSHLTANFCEWSPIQSVFIRTTANRGPICLSYTSDHINVYELLVQQDTRIFKNVFNNTIHPLRAIMPKKKLTKYNLRKETSHHPKINTDRFKNTFVNRLIFKHNLVL